MNGPFLLEFRSQPRILDHAALSSKPWKLFKALSCAILVRGPAASRQQGEVPCELQ